MGQAFGKQRSRPAVLQRRFGFRRKRTVPPSSSAPGPSQQTQAEARTTPDVAVDQGRLRRVAACTVVNMIMARVQEPFFLFIMDPH